MIVLTTMKELPDKCYDCPCRDGENGYCRADEHLRNIDEWRPFWCPLKECNIESSEEK